MNIVTSYIKNIGKSVAFAAIAEVKEKSPAIASFTESNQELYKETFHAIRDYRGTIAKTKQVIQNSSIYKAGDMAFNNALADIKSGNLYNQEREDSFDSFGDMGDFGGDDGFSAAEQANPANPDAATISLSDKMVISAVQDSSKKNAYAVSNAVVSSAQYIANTNKSIANMQYVQNTKMMGMMESGFRGVSNGIDALHRFNATVMTTHAENSKVFFEQTTHLNQERNAILKEMLEMQRNQYQKVVAEEKERKFNRFGDIANANGTPDLKAYMKAIGGNFKNAVDEQSGGMMGMLSGDNLKMLAQNPLGFIPQLLISSMMGPKLNVAIKKLDKTLTGAFATAMARLNKNAGDTEASPLTQFFGKVFGLKNSVKSSIDTSNFDKGTIPFDGETKKAIVEVLPGYLRRIESALTGAPERLYDLKSGKWTDSHAVKKNFERTKNGYVKGAFSDVNTEIQQMLQAIHFENRKDKEDFIKGIESAQKQIYSDFGYYNPHDKDSFKAYKYGFKNKNDQKLFDKMMVNLKHGTMMNMANEVANAREMQNQYMEELEKKGTSVFNNLFNNSGFGSLVDMDEKTGKVKSKLGNLGDAINPLKVEDKFKKNIFDYLRSMDNKLYDIRTMSGNGGGYGGRRRSRRARNGVDYTEFSGKDWDALDKSRNGKPLIKSEKELRDERRANADRNYAANSRRERDRLARSGVHVETYDSYDDDSASRARGSVQGYANVNHALSNRRDLRENTSWLNEFFQDNAKKSRDRLAEKYPNKSNKKESLSTRLMQAATLSDKYDVIRESLDHLTSAPTTMLAGVIEKADANIYDFFYGKDTNDKDEHGNPIKGFFNKMVFDMQKTFGKVNTWIEDTLIKPFNKKFGGSTLWGSAKNAIKKTTGFDVDDTIQRAKDFFVGDNGILRSTIDSIKTSYKEAYEEVKRDMKKSYKDANELYNNKLLGRETDEQRISRVRGTTGLNDISDASAFRYAVANSASTKQAIAKKKKYAAEKNKILEQLRTERDPKKLKYLTKKLNLVNSSIKSLVTNKVEAYNSRNNRIKGINSQIAGYSNDDSEVLSAREAKAAQLSKLKSTLGLDANLDLGSIDTSSGDYAYLNDSQVKGTFNQAKALQTQIAGMKTELEKLKDERDSLQKEQKKAWSTTGTSKDSLMKNSSFLMSYANSHRREFDGDTKAYNEALQDLSNILGISDEKTSTKSIKPESTKTLESRYVSAIGKLANAADPVKVLSVKINKIQNNGGVASKLVSQMNKIVATKGALFGRYRSEFSEALGKMGVSEGQIESTVDKLFDTNTPEQLKKISGSVSAFISAVKQANPSLDGIVSAYEGRDTAVGNYAVQGAYSGFGNTANANYASDAFSAWASESEPIKRESLGFKSQSEIAKETKQYKQQTGLFASGARMITKAGLSVLSPGEAVIPADMNPFNPNAGTADRKVQSANEKRIKNNFLSSIKGMNSDDIGEYANGTTNVGGDGALATGIQNFKDGIGSFLGDATGVSSMKSKVNEANETVRKYLPGAIGGSLVGGTAGLLIGGPLVGAVLGSAVSIAKNSSTLQETLFGKEIVDQNGEKQGRDNSGLISGDMQKSISKYLPDAKAYGITGSILGLLTPFGPLGALGGLMLGSGIAFAKNNDKVKNALFGEKDGLFNGDTQRTVKKAFPNIAAATLGTLFLGPFGLMGNAALGAGIGLVSSTDEFKDFMLGKPDKDGKRTGGLAGEIRNTVVNPLAKMASGVQSRFFNFMQKDMLDPIKLSIAPIGKQISLAIKDTFTGVGKVVSYALKSSLGIPLVKRVGEALKYAMDPFGINKWLLKNGTEYAGKVISAPSKAIGWLGDRARMHQIKKSNADYMTADERLEFMAKHKKDYKLKGYDEMLSNSSKEDLERVKDLMGSLKEGRGFLDDRYDEATKNLGGAVSDKFDVHTSKKIIKAAQNGEMDLAMSLIQNSDLPTVEKEKLSKEVNKHADRFREISYRKNTYTKNEDVAYKELQERFGIKGINKDNISKFRSVLDTEITSRHPKSDKEEESQSTEITSTIDANTNKLIDALAMINTTLTTMRDGATGLDADQQEALKATRELGDSTASAYAAKNNLSAARKNSLVSKYYGEGFKLDDKHKNLFQDNDKRFKQVHGLAKAGYNFSNLNDALDYDQDSFDRFEKLAKAGYKLEKPADYKKISEMSASGFENVLEMSKAGMKITDLNYAVNLDAKKRDSMIELYQNGYDNVSPKELEKLIGKKSQLLYGPQADKAKAAARASKNADAGVKADGIYQVNTNHIGPEDANPGFFKRQLSKAKGLGSDIMSQARAMADTYGPGLQMIPIMAGAGKAGMMQGSHQQDDSNKQQVTVNTDYGVETYTRSTDGSLDLAKNKQNQDIADKINQRDQTQKGILESLKAMAGDAKAKGKGMVEKAKDSKGGLLGLLAGLAGMLKLPLTMLKSLGSLINLPMKMLGLGGVLPGLAGKVGSFALSKAKGLFNWGAKKVGGLASAGWNKLANTKLGQKIGNSKIGRLFSKAKGMIGGGGGAGGAGADADGNPVDNPQDPADAINVQRDTLSSYLQKIIDLLSNTSGAAGAGPMKPLSDSLRERTLGGHEATAGAPAGKKPGAPDGKKPGAPDGKKPGILGRIGGFFNKHAGKIALGLGAAGALAGAFTDDESQITSSFTDDAITMMQVGEDAANTGIGNSKIGPLFSKAKGKIGGDADGNPVDNPQDPVDAINVQRDTLSSYLQKIIDLLSNTSGAAGGPDGKKPGGPDGEKPGGPDGKKPGAPDGKKPGAPDGKRPGAPGAHEATAGAPGGNRPGAPDGNRPGAPGGNRPGVLGRIGGFFSKHADKIALGLDVAGSFTDDESQTTSSFTDDAITTMQVGEDIANTGIGSTILTKTKDALRNIGNKISKFIPKGAGEAVQRFFGVVYDKISNSKSIEKIAKRAGIKLGMDAAEATVGAGTLGIGALAIGAGEAVMWFMKGWNETNDNFSLQNNAEPSMGMKFISGISEAVIGMTPIGYVIDTKDVIDLATQYIGPAVGFNKSDTNRINSNASNGGSDDNSNGNNSDNSKGFLSSAWDTVKGVASKAADMVGNAYEGAKSMVKSGANWVGDKVSGFANWAKSKFGGGKYGRGKYGRGKYGRGKYGRGAMDDIKASISDIPMNSVPDYNRINDDDDLTVARAKAANIRKLYGKAAPTPAAPTSVSDIAHSSTPAMQTPFAPAPQQNTTPIPDYNQVKDDDDLLVRQAKLAAQAKARQNAAPTAAVAVQNTTPVAQSAARIPDYNKINDDDDLLVRRSKTIAQAKAGQTTPIYSNRTQTSQSSAPVASTPTSNTTSSYQTTLYSPTQNGVNDDNKIDYLHDSIQTIQAKRRAQILARAARVRQGIPQSTPTISTSAPSGAAATTSTPAVQTNISTDNRIDLKHDSLQTYQAKRRAQLLARARAARQGIPQSTPTISTTAPAVQTNTPTISTDNRIDLKHDSLQTYQAKRRAQLLARARQMRHGEGKWGRGAIDDIRASIADIPMDSVPDYNQIKDDDDLLVAKAKAANIRKLYGKQTASPVAPAAQTTDAAIPAYNQINDDDDLLVRQAKLAAQAKARQTAAPTAAVTTTPTISTSAPTAAVATTTTPTISAPAVQTTTPTISTDNRIDLKQDSLQTYQAKRRAQLLARARAARVSQGLPQPAPMTSLVATTPTISTSTPAVQTSSTDNRIDLKHDSLQTYQAKRRAQLLARARAARQGIPQSSTATIPTISTTAPAVQTGSTDNRIDLKHDSLQTYQAKRRAQLLARAKQMRHGGGKWGRGAIDDIRASISDIPMDSVPDYNQIKDDDDILVAKAKAANIRKLYGKQTATAVAPAADVVASTPTPTTDAAVPAYNQINDDDDLLVRQAKLAAQAKARQNATPTAAVATTTPAQSMAQIPDYNQIKDEDDLTVRQAKLVAQAKAKQGLPQSAPMNSLVGGIPYLFSDKSSSSAKTTAPTISTTAPAVQTTTPTISTDNRIDLKHDSLQTYQAKRRAQLLARARQGLPQSVVATTTTPTISAPAVQTNISTDNRIDLKHDSLQTYQAKRRAQLLARARAARVSQGIPQSAVATTTPTISTSAPAVQTSSADNRIDLKHDSLQTYQAKRRAQLLARARQGLPQSAPMTASAPTISTSTPAVQTNISTDNRIDLKHDSLQTYQAKRRAQLLARARAARVSQMHDGQGKWGRGAVASDATEIFHSQLNPVNTMEFNAPGDSQYQNMADSGCGPASAANMASALGVPMDTKAAASYALEKGYKEKDGGTRPEFFKDYLGKAGIQTSDLSGQSDIKSQLSSGHPVLLMGTDSHNSPATDAMGKSGTPFGPNPHYVVATGMDKDNITIQDPESNTPNQKYKTSKVLNNSSLAMAAGRGKFGNKFGRGKTRSIFGRGSKPRTKYGRGACEEDPPFGSIAGMLAAKCGSSHPEFFWAQMMNETGGPERYKEINARIVGFDDHNYGGFSWYEGMGEQYRSVPRPEGGYYAKFSSDEEYVEMAYNKIYKSYASELAQCNTAEEFAQVLKNHGYYDSGPAEYAANMASVLNGKYKNSLSKIHAGPSSSNGGNNKSGGKDYSGLFGQIAQITDTLAGAFTVGAPPASNAPTSTKQSANQQANAAIADLMAKVKAGKIGIEDFIQQADDNPNINRDQIWKALADAGYGDADTKAAFDKYYKAMDDASTDKKYQILGDNLKAGTLSVADFVQQADAMPNVPRNSIKHVLMQDNLWNDENKAIYDDYYDKKDGVKSKDDNSNNTATDDGSSGEGKFGRGKFGRSKFGRGMSALSKMTPIKFGRSKFGRGKFGRGTDDQATNDTPAMATTPITDSSTTTTPNTDSSATTPTTTTDPKADPNKAKTTAPKPADNGIFGAALTAANTLSSKMKKYMGPLAKAIGSTATKLFGGNIAKIFGSTNPFDSIFSSGQKANANTNNTNKTNPNGTFNSTSTDEGIRAASAWAQSVLGQSLYEDNGCTAFVRDYLLKANNPVGKLMQDGSQGNLMWVPDLAKWARANGTWKDASQGGAEGDIAVTLNEGHVIIADGQGGAWGHGGDHTIKHYSSISGAFGQPDGYISTGSGAATVSNGDATRSKEEMIADAGSSNGGGKWGRGKWGRGTNFGPRYGKGSKFGRSKMDDIMQSVAYAPSDKISPYNLIDPNTDDLFVAQAKADNIKKLFPPKDIAKQVQKQIINPLPATSSAASTPVLQATPVVQTTTTTTAQQQPAQPVVNVPDNGEKLDSIIQLLTGIGGQLAVIANALTNGDGKVSPAQARTAVRQAMANGGGFSDMFGGQDTSSIFQAMTAVATK